MEPLPAIDHDRLFKELLTTFFFEFLELFFPVLAAETDPGSITFLDKEIFLSLFEGAEIEADIVAQVRFHGATTYFLVHIENQSTPQAEFGKRMYQYFNGLHTKYGVPIYPIVVFSYATPKRAEPHIYRIEFPDGEVLRFTYRVVQLNRLSWRQFIKHPNAIASALMAKMKIASRDRPRVKLECLRLLATLKLDPARMRLISGFIDTYLRLSALENQRFEKAITGSDLAPEQKAEVMEIVTSWMETGIEQGRQEGRQEGLTLGRLQEAKATLIRLGTKKFGSPDALIAQRIENAELSVLEVLTDRLLETSSWQELFPT